MRYRMDLIDGILIQCSLQLYIFSQGALWPNGRGLTSYLRPLRGIRIRIRIRIWTVRKFEHSARSP